jgi:hypothetical protein
MVCEPVEEPASRIGGLFPPVADEDAARPYRRRLSRDSTSRLCRERPVRPPLCAQEDTATGRCHQRRRGRGSSWGIGRCRSFLSLSPAAHRLAGSVSCRVPCGDARSRRVRHRQHQPQSGRLRRHRPRQVNWSSRTPRCTRQPRRPMSVLGHDHPLKLRPFDVRQGGVDRGERAVRRWAARFPSGNVREAPQAIEGTLSLASARDRIPLCAR